MLYKYLPYFISKRLFGDRKKFGLKLDKNDPDYLEWEKNYLKFYIDNQKNHLGKIVNHYGFKISRMIDLSEKKVLELGPGIIEHLKYTTTVPKEYLIADTKDSFLETSAKILQNFGIVNVQKIKVDGITLPIDDNEIDIIFSFHQLEHIYDLDTYVKEIKRILKPAGLLIGAVPCEGGIAWGLGRFLTSRRYVKKYMNFNYDKIICWEHPNFVNRIRSVLRNNLCELTSIKRPLNLLPFDCNLSWSFIFKKEPAL